MNVDALLACRVTGSRLHGKPVQNLTPDGPMIIESLVSYLKEVKSIRKIALCIAEGNENLVFQNIAEEKGLPYMFGPEDDVLKRLIKAGDYFDTDVVFRITSEGPFVLHDYADQLIKEFINGGYDWGTLDQSPEGTGYELIKLDALKKSHINGTERNRSELVTSYICENQKEFKMLFMEIDSKLQRPEVRLTVDYAEDLIFCQKVYRELKEPGKLIKIQDIINFWDSNPEARKPLENIGIDWGTGRLNFKESE